MIPLISTGKWTPVSIVTDEAESIFQLCIELHDQGEFNLPLSFFWTKNSEDPSRKAGQAKTLVNNQLVQAMNSTSSHEWAAYDLLKKTEVRKCINRVIKIQELFSFSENAKRHEQTTDDAEIIYALSIGTSTNELFPHWGFDFQLATNSIAGQYVIPLGDRTEVDELKKIKPKVGSVTYSNSYIVFDIKPRFGDSVLYHMLGKVFQGSEMAEIERFSSENPLGSLFYLAMFWIGAFNRAYRNGLPRLYRNYRNDLPVLRGRMDVSRQLQNQLSGHNPDKIACNYRELTFDNIINRILRWCARRIRRILGGNLPGALNNLIRAEQLLASYGVPLRHHIDLHDFQHIHYTAMAEAYKPLMKLSEALIRSTPEGLGGELKTGYSFLFDVSELWEYYLLMVVEERLPDSLEIGSANDDKSLQKHLLLNSKSDPDSKLEQLFNLKPDMVVYPAGKKNEPIAILDAKYKYTNDNPNKNFGISQNDIYQLVTYLYRYQTCNHLNGSLIFPRQVALAFIDQLYPTELKPGTNPPFHVQNSWLPDTCHWQLNEGQDWPKIALCNFVLPIFFHKLHRHNLPKGTEYSFYKIRVATEEASGESEIVLDYYLKSDGTHHRDLEHLSKIINGTTNNTEFVLSDFIPNANYFTVEEGQQVLEMCEADFFNKISRLISPRILIDASPP